MRRLGLALATGYVLMFFAERVFWSRWRPGEDDAGAFVMTWLLYSFGGEICLLSIRRFRVADIWPMFLVGALLGWFVEGIFTMTFFGVDGIPFPYTISWTGLSWHALIAVVVGWYGLQTALLRSFRRSALVSGLLGLFWGFWSIFWGRTAHVGPPSEFAAHAFLTTFGLMAAFRAFHACRPGQLRVSRIEAASLGIIVLAYFLGVTVARFGGLALITLPPLFALIFLALRHNAVVETGPDFLTAIDRPIPWPRLLAVLLMPALAVAIHEGCRFGGLSFPSNLWVLAVTLPAGALGFVLSLWKVSRRRPEVASFFAQLR